MSKRGAWVLAALVLLAVAVAGTRWWRGAEQHAGVPAEGRALEELDALAGMFPEAGEEPLAWPRDHGAKPEQFAESWLFAGVLRDPDGRRYGFQLAFFRVAVQAEAPTRNSAWATRDVYRARLSIEPAGEPAASEERFSRDALGLAGAASAPARAWVEDWSFAVNDPLGVIELRAMGVDAGLDLRIEPHGTLPTAVDGALYRGYWWPGLSVDGHLLTDGRSVPVTGRAMLDRLWGRALPAGRGQLSLACVWLEPGNGRAIRCEHLQRRGGGGTPLAECLARPLGAQAPAVTPAGDGWRSVAGRRYPLRWEAALSADEPSLRITPLEMRHAVSFDGTWAGVMVVDGSEEAWGLLELSNFSEP
jgi:predicted secreted hydrolase